METLGLWHFAGMGLLGGLTYGLLWAKKFSDLIKYKVFRHAVVGFIIGIVYYYLHVQHGLPDSVGAYIAGYAGSDFISALASKFFGPKIK